MKKYLASALVALAVGCSGIQRDQRDLRGYDIAPVISEERDGFSEAYEDLNIRLSDIPGYAEFHRRRN